jgi:hypothetical protein
MKHVLANLGPEDRLFVASHNQESIDISTQIIRESPHLVHGQVLYGQLKGFSD